VCRFWPGHTGKGRWHKALGVPARDAQIILGHSRLAITLEVYTHTDDEAQLDALTRLHNLFDQT
jgi:integrase